MKKKLTSTSPLKLLKDNSTLLLVLTIAAVYGFICSSLYGGGMSRQVANMLIPISVYIVLAVSLNLVVGLLGELSLGHSGFMCSSVAFLPRWPALWWVFPPCASRVTTLPS